MEFSRQEYWSGLPFPPPRDLPWPRDLTCISCVSFTVGGFFTCSAIKYCYLPLLPYRRLYTPATTFVSQIHCHFLSLQDSTSALLEFSLHIYFSIWQTALTRPVSTLAAIVKSSVTPPTSAYLKLHLFLNSLTQEILHSCFLGHCLTHSSCSIYLCWRDNRINDHLSPNFLHYLMLSMTKL